MASTSAAPFGSYGQSRRERALARRRRVAELAVTQDQVISTRQLAELGISYEETRAEVTAGRWHKVGLRTVSVAGPTPTTDAARRRWALWEVGGRACLDGVSALAAWGLTRWEEDTVHVSVPQGARYRRVPGVRVHVLRDRGEVVTAGLPRTRQEVAALRAAVWARSDRAAATVLAMSVQQRLVEPRRLLRAWEGTGRCARRDLLARVVPLVCDGAQALSEIDLAVLGQARGWPEPDRQVVVRTALGRIYLDVRFTAYRTVVEVNGVQHYEGLATVADAIRRNDHVLDGVTALEIPALGLVLTPEPFLEQVEAALRRGGWPGPATKRTSETQGRTGRVAGAGD